MNPETTAEVVALVESVRQDFQSLQKSLELYRHLVADAAEELEEYLAMYEAEFAGCSGFEKESRRLEILIAQLQNAASGVLAPPGRSADRPGGVGSRTTGHGEESMTEADKERPLILHTFGDHLRAIESANRRYGRRGPLDAGTRWEGHIYGYITSLLEHLNAGGARSDWNYEGEKP